jgi:hypothetical protein
MLVFGGFAALLGMMVFYRYVYWRSDARHRFRVPRAGSGAAVLRLPPGHNLLLGVLAFLPGALLAAMSLTVRWGAGSEGSGPILAAAVGLPAAAAAAFLFAQEGRQRIVVDDAGIERTGVFRRRRLGWGEVARIVYNPMNRWFLVTAPARPRIWVAVGLDGIADFAEIALARLPRAVLAASPDAEEELRDLAAERDAAPAPVRR